MSLIAHELGHAIHWLLRFPDDVHSVEIKMMDNHTEAVPTFIDEGRVLGIGRAVNFLAGCVAERVARGETNIASTAADYGKDMINWLMDTPFAGQWDKACFLTIMGSYERVPMADLARELVYCERFIRQGLPEHDLTALEHELNETGSLEFYGAEPVLH